MLGRAIILYLLKIYLKLGFGGNLLMTEQLPNLSGHNPRSILSTYNKKNYHHVLFSLNEPSKIGSHHLSLLLLINYSLLIKRKVMDKVLVKL